jgi:hypothetical protein
MLPKAEALSCLRALLVDLKSFKVDMICVMVESMGLLYVFCLAQRRNFGTLSHNLRRVGGLRRNH